MLIQLHETDKSCLSFGIKVKVVDYILKNYFQKLYVHAGSCSLMTLGLIELVLLRYC